MKTSVSIIIPVYNVEEYLAKCIYSVVNQTFKGIEIILVNDGSSDRGGKLCDEFSLEDKRIIVIHQKNSGLSEARNVGTQSAKGDYIFYLDSDDWLELDCIESLLNISLLHNADIVQSGFYYNFSDYKVRDSSNTDTIILSREQVMTKLLEQKQVKNFAWGKLYKKNIVKSVPFVKGVFLEDSFWKHLVLDKINIYVIFPTPLYHYFQRKNSMSGTYSIRSLDLLKGTYERVCFINKKYPHLYALAVDEFYKLIYTSLPHINRLPNQSRILAFDQTIKMVSKLSSQEVKFKILSKLKFLIPIWNLGNRAFNFSHRRLMHIFLKNEK